MTALAYAHPMLDPPAIRAQSNAASQLGFSISRLLLDATSHARNNASDWRPFTKALIEKLALECQTPNWDGYGARPISESAKKQAQLFVELLPFRFQAPEPVADPDGDVALSWDFGPGHVFTVSIDSSGTLSYAGLLGQGIKRHGVEPFKGSIPKAITDSINELTERSAVTG